jgi:hypothetical protein
MPVQMIELEEVTMVEVSDEDLEAGTVRSKYTVNTCECGW